MISYKPIVFDEQQIKNLYLENQWYAYTNDIDMLYNGIKNSTDCIGAYEGDILAGLIRTVSDLQTICYIQDILILDAYKKQGIGTKLMKIILDKYSHVRQINLMTGIEDFQRSFYESFGFVPFEKVQAVGYTFKREKS